MAAYTQKDTQRQMVAAEQGADWATAEASLGHSVGSTVEQAYQRSDLLEQRRGLMEQWGTFCAGWG